jgi:hypothetical protein
MKKLIMMFSVLREIQTEQLANISLQHNANLKGLVIHFVADLYVNLRNTVSENLLIIFVYN